MSSHSSCDSLTMQTLIPIFSVRKQRLREVESPSAGHTASKWLIRDLKPGCRHTTGLERPRVPKVAKRSGSGLHPHYVTVQHRASAFPLLGSSGLPCTSPLPPSMSVFSVSPLVSRRVLSLCRFLGPSLTVSLSAHLGPQPPAWSFSHRLQWSPRPGRVFADPASGQTGLVRCPTQDTAETWISLAAQPFPAGGSEFGSGPGPRTEKRSGFWGRHSLSPGELSGSLRTFQGSARMPPREPRHGGGWWGSDKTQIPPDRSTAPHHVEDT